MRLWLTLYVSLLTLGLVTTWPSNPVAQTPGLYTPYHVPAGYELEPVYAPVSLSEPIYVPNPHGSHDLLHEPCVAR
jgi:hypothetical protein